MTSDIIAGSSVPGLAKSIARRMGTKAHFPSIEKFPDGEIHVVEGDYTPAQTVVYVQTMHPHPNDMLVEMMLTVDLLKELGAERVIAVIPYVGYMRQDARHVKGEAVAIRTMLKMLDFAGVNDIVGVDMHLHRLGIEELASFSRIKIHEVSAVELLAARAGKGLTTPLVVGPDSESERWAAAAARVLGTDYDVLEKHRLSAREIEHRPRSMAVKGRDVLIIDDIVSTGGTIKDVIKSLKAQGAGQVNVACTHAVLSDIDSLTGLYRTGMEEIVSTNTINNESGIVDVSEIIAGKLKELL
ncbi:ribose-phosphate diphosphokinase [Methanocella arvoryzae]|uniref:ribose-phosphate diphosphokinase n=1 Tax=Methanocella arvoryzae (strain DSM 22066 / NBRC 105507 / MRE50) TaxID=351160 RepID=Q0W4S8_METAR|nr:ribose-phosphate diphosphokinase [Methanocella arvoryzae]CAJ36615.1 ribose-phosphate pyrophosphokinase [Methanocella arvoryzae MRE50]